MLFLKINLAKSVHVVGPFFVLAASKVVEEHTSFFKTIYCHYLASVATAVTALALWMIMPGLDSMAPVLD